MTNYPDNMGDDSHLDSDETGNKLSCGCYEEQCECEDEEEQRLFSAIGDKPRKTD